MNNKRSMGNSIKTASLRSFFAQYIHPLSYELYMIVDTNPQPNDYMLRLF